MEALFGNVKKNEKNILLGDKSPNSVVIAPFHLGFPLDLCRGGIKCGCDQPGWTVFSEIRRELLGSRFIPVNELDLSYDDNISVPMGKPLVIKDSEKCTGDGTMCFLLLFPTGLFLVMVLYFDHRALKIIEDVHETDKSFGYSAYGILEETGRRFGQILKNWFCIKVLPFKPLFDDSHEAELIDAYYIALHDNEEAEDIKYQDAMIHRTHGSVVLYTYISYYSILWLHKQLCRQVNDLKDRLLAKRPAPKGMLENLKALNLHIRRLIAETNPYSIRITQDYVAAMATMRTAYEMESIEGAIGNQSELLQDVVIWFDSQEKDRFNNSIGLAALLLSFVSITSVIAQLISTIDFANQYDSAFRLVLIVGGSLGITSSIVLLTYAAWRKFLKGCK